MRSTAWALSVSCAAFLVAAASNAEEPDPVAVIDAMIKAFNDHDVDKATSYFSDDFVLTLRPAYLRLTDETHSGKEYTRKWVKDLVDGNFRIRIDVLKVAGNRVRTRTTTRMNVTERLGLAPVVGIEDYVVENGRIARLTWTTSEETRQRFLSLRRTFFAGVGAASLLLVALGWWVARRVRGRRALERG